MVKNPPANARLGSIPWLGRSPGKEMATHSIFLPGKSHGEKEPGGLQSMGLQESYTA